MVQCKREVGGVWEVQYWARRRRRFACCCSPRLVLLSVGWLPTLLSGSQVGFTTWIANVIG
jgi:drug/metabolite transporter superfamily protein YnfA